MDEITIGKIPEDVKKVLNVFDITIEQMSDIATRLANEIKLGLDGETHLSATVKMYPTYVQSLPDGTERGNYIVVDLGGSKFRIHLVRIEAGHIHIDSKVYPIAVEKSTMSGKELFDYIANCVQDLQTTNGTGQTWLAIGFIFSFPCKQKSLHSGTLVTWTKEFSASGVEGEDVIKLLHDACRKKGIETDLIAFVNDTIGTLMSCAHDDQNTRVGVVLGTGSKACYVEDIHNVGTWHGTKEGKETIVNTEWGAFGDDGVLEDIRTDYDKETDKAVGTKVGERLYEKMISAKYLGEICRQVMIKLARDGLLFKEKTTTELEQLKQFETSFLIRILKNANDVDDIFLKNYGFKPSIQDRTIIHAVCKAVLQRSCHLAVAGIATLVKRVSKTHGRNITVGIDGTLCRQLPVYIQEMESKIKKLLPEVSVKFMLSREGAGKGAALIAAVAHRKLDSSKHPK